MEDREPVLLESIDGKRFVSIRRDRVEATSLGGFVVGFSPKLTLINVISNEVYLNGFMIVRTEDITAVDHEKSENVCSI